MKKMKRMFFVITMVVTLAAGSIASYAAELPETAEETVFPETETAEDVSAEAEESSQPVSEITETQTDDPEDIPEIQEEAEETAESTETVSEEEIEALPENEQTGSQKKSTETVALQEDGEEGGEEESQPEIELAVPVLHACSVTKNSILVSWDAVENAEKYEIYLYNETTAAWDPVGSATAAKFEYKTLTPGTTYRFTVAAAAGTVTGEYNAKGVSVVYLAPVKVSAKRAAKTAYIKWQKAAGAKGYTIYRRNKGASAWKALKNVSAGTTVYKDRTVVTGKSYEYLVRAYAKADGTTWYSIEDSSYKAGFCALAAPVITKTKNNAKGLQVIWKKVKGAKKYLVLRKTKKGNWKKLGYSTTHSFVDKTAQSGKSYTYTVAAYSAQGTQGYYKTKGFTGFYLAPAAKPELENLRSAIQLTWSKVKGANGYRVFKSQVKSSKWTKVADVTSLSYTDYSVKDGKKYKYMAVPYRLVKGKKQLASWTKNSKNTIIRIAAPELKSITSASGGIQISWNSVKAGKEYCVFRRQSKSDEWKQIAVVTDEEYLDETVKNGKLYYYTVAARKNSSISSYGNSVQKGMYLPRPEMTKKSSEYNGLRLEWKALKYASGYKVYRIRKSGSLKYIGKTTSTSFTDTNVKDGHTYTYAVRAYNNKCKKCLGEYRHKGITAKYTDPFRKVIRESLNASGWSLREAFDWARAIQFIDQQPDAANTRDFAKWVLENNKGDCYGKAAVFVMMARELGYEAYVMKGWTPFNNGGGTYHGWSEVKVDGEWFVCDLSYNNGGVNSAYLVKYGQPGTLRYSDYKRLP